VEIRDDARFEDALVFDMILHLVCVAGFDGYWKRMNSAWTRALGWTTEELMSRPILDFVHPDDRAGVVGGRERLYRGEPLVGLINRYRMKDGAYRWLEWRSIAHPQRQLVYAVARDVTEQKEAERVVRELAERQRELERRLIAADRLASVGTLAAGVAHEINNPLAYVTSNLDLLLEDVGQHAGGSLSAPTAEWVELARDARQGCDRIRKIVRELMTFARPAEERRAAVELQPVLDLSIDMARHEIRHRARLVKDFGDTPRVEADETHLGQVFINLLVNAAHAIPEGDARGNEIRVVTGTDDEGRAFVEVHDTGVGIPEDVLGRLFDPFFTTKPVGAGTGLGLSVSHGIVTDMGGEITARNRTDRRGATFRVVLPAATRAVAPDEDRPRAAAAPSARPARVLVVDDERSLGEVLAKILRGHEVTALTSAKQALEAIAKSEVPSDVILLDVMMPEMSGMELYEQLLRAAPRLAERTVFMTGGAFTPAANAFLHRVPNTRIEKPFEPSAVRALVERLAKPGG
jgi:PAS domain S-box-containing protein